MTEYRERDGAGIPEADKTATVTETGQTPEAAAAESVTETGQTPEAAAGRGEADPTDAVDAADAEREPGIEETLAELEALIEKMEDRSSTLEETFACYERGMKLVKACSEKIDRVEKRLMILTEDGEHDGV